MIQSTNAKISALPEYKKKYNRNFSPQVVTNNFFTQAAVDLAKLNDIELIDRKIITKWI